MAVRHPSETACDGGRAGLSQRAGIQARVARISEWWWELHLHTSGPPWPLMHLVLDVYTGVLWCDVAVKFTCLKRFYVSVMFEVHTVIIKSGFMLLHYQCTFHLHVDWIGTYTDGNWITHLNLCVRFITLICQNTRVWGIIVRWVLNLKGEESLTRVIWWIL